MKHATTRELFSYWSRLRGQRAAPERSDVDPAEIRNILADVFILEADADGGFPLRVVGARINAIFGRELKGRSFTTLWRDSDRGSFARLAQTVLNDARPALAGAAAAPPGRLRADLELLLLPLRHNGRTHARLLGSLSPGAVPSWLGLLAVEDMTLGSMRIIGVEEDRARQTDGAPTPRGSPKRRRHLFVHEGGR